MSTSAARGVIVSTAVPGLIAIPTFIPLLLILLIVFLASSNSKQNPPTLLYSMPHNEMYIGMHRPGQNHQSTSNELHIHNDTWSGSETIK
jgi:hypothetical protein